LDSDIPPNPMATEDQIETPAVATLTSSQLEAFKTLLKNCQGRGLTQLQQEQPPGDVCDGINDDATLMYDAFPSCLRNLLIVIQEIPARAELRPRRCSGTV
jgi:hypothetical protein